MVVSSTSQVFNSHLLATTWVARTERMALLKYSHEVSMMALPSSLTKEEHLRKKSKTNPNHNQNEVLLGEKISIGTKGLLCAQAHI